MPAACRGWDNARAAPANASESEFGDVARALRAADTLETFLRDDETENADIAVRHAGSHVYRKPP